MARIGYARVSTDDQRADLQIDALREAGCERIFTDEGVSGKLAARPELDACLAYLRPGDTLVVWRLDRLGRSVQHLVTLINTLAGPDPDHPVTGFASLTEGIDTTTNGGRLVFHIFAAIAEFERGLIRERTMAGLDAARARGKKGGGKPKLSPDQVARAQELWDAKQLTVAEIGALFGMSRQGMYRYLDTSAERLAGTSS